jgi:hypothetical protein
MYAALRRTQLPASRHTVRQSFSPVRWIAWFDPTATIRAMFEVEIYARGLREMANILELDRQLVEIAGLHYKMDTNHDIVYLEFDEPTLSIREIRAIFLKLDLEPLFIGAIPPELQSRTKTERLSV